MLTCPKSWVKVHPPFIQVCGGHSCHSCNFPAVMSIESGLIVYEKDQKKLPYLRNCKAWRWSWLIAIFVICYHPFLILFPLLSKFASVLDNIIPFMAINIPSPLFCVHIANPICEAIAVLFKHRCLIFLNQACLVSSPLQQNLWHPGHRCNHSWQFQQDEAGYIRLCPYLQGWKSGSGQRNERGAFQRWDICESMSQFCELNNCHDPGIFNKQTSLSPCVWELRVKV